MATQRTEHQFADSDGPMTPCVRCQVATTGTLFASANVFTGVDENGIQVNQWLKPIPVCERHRLDLSRNMGVLSWCVSDQAWGLKGWPCTTCGRLLTIGYRRS